MFDQISRGAIGLPMVVNGLSLVSAPILLLWSATEQHDTNAHRGTQGDTP